MQCDQCEALMINGVFCHEHGCPNTRKAWNAITETWETEYTCPECGGTYTESEDARECCSPDFDIDAE